MDNRIISCERGTVTAKDGMTVDVVAQSVLSIRTLNPDTTAVGNSPIEVVSKVEVHTIQMGDRAG